MRKEIIKLSQSRQENPHYKYFAYSKINGYDNFTIVVFGFSPIVDEIDPTIIIDETKVWVGWKAFVNDKWYGDFVTVGNAKDEIEEAVDVLYDQAKRTINEILSKDNLSSCCGAEIVNQRCSDCKENV